MGDSPTPTSTCSWCYGKYTTALRLGTAETEAILCRFTRNNVQHPTYKGFAELGRQSRQSSYANIFIAKHCG